MPFLDYYATDSSRTITDGGGDYTISSGTPNLVTVTTQQRKALNYIAFDKGAGNISTSYKIRQKFNVSAFSATGAAPHQLFVSTDALCNVDLDATTTADAIGVIGNNPSNTSGGVLFIVLFENGVRSNSASSIAYNTATNYWLEVFLDLTVGTYGTIYVKLFSDSTYSTQVGSTISLARGASNTYRYVMPLIGDHHATSTVTYSATFSDCEFIPQVSANASVTLDTVEVVSSINNLGSLELSLDATLDSIGLSAQLAQYKAVQSNVTLDGIGVSAYCNPAAENYATDTLIYTTTQTAIGSCVRSNIHMTGDFFRAFLNVSDGTTEQSLKIVHGDVDTGAFQAGASLADTNSSTKVKTANQIETAFNSLQYKNVTAWSTFTTNLIGIFADNTNDNLPFTFTTGQNSGSYGFITSDGQWHAAIYDYTNYLWAATTQSSGTAVAVKRNRNRITAADPWEAQTVIESGLGGSVAMQFVAYPNSDVGLVYSNGNALRYAHWTYLTNTWGTPESITTTNNAYDKFSSTVTNSGRLVVVWVDQTDTTAIVMHQRVSGSWGSTTTTSSMVASCKSLTLSKDEGAVDACYLYYAKDGGIFKRNIISGSLGSETLLKALPSSITGSTFQCIKSSIDRFGVMYQLSNGQVRFASHTEAAVERGVNGILISKRGAPSGATMPFVKQMVDYGDYSVIFVNGDNSKVMGGIWDRVTSSWVLPLTAISERYWDIHAMASSAISPDGYVYYAYWGRSSQGDPKVKKSNYPIGHASFTSMTLFTDISPSMSGTGFGATPAATLRGYKYMEVDSNGVLHFGLMGSSSLYINNYNGTSWSGWKYIANFEAPTNQVMYTEGMKLGKETSGQQSLHIATCLTDTPSGIYSNSAWCVGAWYLKVVMQADRTYLGYDITGASVTLPITETLTGATKYFDHGVDTTHYYRHWGGFDVLEDNTPIMVSQRCGTTYDPVDVSAYRWDGSAWVRTTASSSISYPASVELNSWTPRVFHVPATGKIHVTYSSDASGTFELFEATSTDSGATWSSPIQRTTETFHTMNPIVDSTILYNIKNTQDTSEVRMIPRYIPFNPRWAKNNNQVIL